jgi:hypothetical protein
LAPGLEIAVGFGVAGAVAWGARVLQFDRDRSFYSIVLIVIASIYILFAALTEQRRIVVIETAFAAIFIMCALVASRGPTRLVGAALAAHALFDVAHPILVSNPGVPEWWPAFCATVDVVLCAAAWSAAWRPPRTRELIWRGPMPRSPGVRADVVCNTTRLARAGCEQWSAQLLSDADGTSLDVAPAEAVPRG